MTFSDANEELARFGIPRAAEGDERLSYLVGLASLVERGEKGLAVKVVQAAYRQDDESSISRKKKVIDSLIVRAVEFRYDDNNNEWPLCSVIMLQESDRGLRDEARVVYGGEHSTKRTRKLGSAICGRCRLRDTCDVRIE